MRIAPLGLFTWLVVAAAEAHADSVERMRAQMAVTRGPETESCIERAELQKAVEQRLRRDVFSGTPGLGIEVKLERKADRFEAELVLRDVVGQELGRRVLETRAKDCSALDASLALVIALLVDSPPSADEVITAGTPAPVEPSSQATAATPKPSRPPTSIELPRDTHAPREPWRFEPAVSFAAALDRLPGFAFGPRLALGFRAPHFPEFRASVGLLLPREQTLDSGQGGARFTLVDVSLEFCPLELERAPLRVSGCFGQSVGRLGVTGLGFDRNDEQVRLDYVFGAGVASWFYFSSSFGLRAGVTAGVPLTRDAYVAHAAGGERLEVFRRGILVGLAELSLGMWL